MKTAVVYCSCHHGNTKKVLDAIAQNTDMTLINAAEAGSTPLDGYDLIGFASGIYYSKFHKSVLRFVEEHLPEGKKVFFLYTCGAEKKGYTEAIRKIAAARHADILGEFGCSGYDTFGPFKLVGGIAKGRPNQGDLSNAVLFFEKLTK